MYRSFPHPSFRARSSIGERKDRSWQIFASQAQLNRMDADVVMFLYRPDSEITTPFITTKLLIAKHRNGPTGEIDLLFQGNRIKFASVEKKRETE
jgi:hypothetical protein